MCPAATPLDGPEGTGPSILCGVIMNERKRSDQISDGNYVGHHLEVGKDAVPVYGFCCGQGLPAVTGNEEHAHGHYTFCPKWRKEKERILEARRRLQVPLREQLPEGTFVQDEGAGTLDDIAPPSPEELAGR
jgi:hypothetical protein